jgi:hypothetical protein
MRAMHLLGCMNIAIGHGAGTIGSIDRIGAAPTLPHAIDLDCHFFPIFIE